MATQETYEKSRKELMENALIPPKINFADIKSALLENSPQNITSIAESFAFNLEEAINLSTLPFQTAFSISSENLWSRTLLREKIMSGYEPENHANTEFEKTVTIDAKAKFDEYMSNFDRTETDEEFNLLYDVIDQTNRLISTGAMADVSRTVLLQAEVMIWNSLEILVKDLMEAGMNSSDLLRKNFASSGVPSKWNLSRIDLSSIEEYGFDLRGHFGTIALATRELSDISTVRTLVSAVLGSDPEVDRPLADKPLYDLSKRRHLIVHRRAIVDKKFIKETSSTQNVGEALNVSPRNIIHYTTSCLNTGIAILKSVSGKLPI